jgi:class 3 adenylate cyclase
VRKVRAGDAALVAILLPLWIACAALHLKQLAAGQLAWVGVYVRAPSADGFPTVRGFWPGAAPDAAGALAVGDRLLGVGDADLRGVGPFGFVARTYAAAAERHDLRVPLAYEHDGVAGSTTIALVPVAYPWRMLPLTCTLVLTGALVLVRRPGTRVARAFFLLAVAYGLHWTFFFGGPRLQSEAWLAVFSCASLVMLPLILRGVLIFPAEVAPAGGRLPWWPWLFAVFGPISLSAIYGRPLPPEVGFRAVFVVNIVFIATLLAVVTRNYRRAGPIGRRQLKWILLGMYVGTVPVLLADAVAFVEPELWWLHEVALIAEIFIPLCILIAVVRTNYFDVDRLITGAALYSILSVVLLAAVLIAVPQTAHLLSRVVGLDHNTVQLGLSLLVAGGMLPTRRFLGPRVERVLFQERHALRAGVEDLLRELPTAAGPEELLTLVGERLDGLVRPRTCVIYAPLGERFVPVFAGGTDGDPPTLPIDAASMVALRTATAPLDVERWTPAPGHAPGRDERAALEQLRAAALLPVRRGAELAAAICLGAKRSGDVYTATDLTLLAAVADKVSAELLRFDAEVILRQERSMSEALRRYVPRAVAARLTEGQPIEGSERDVSVLFVDIRGYTSFSETRAVGAVFSMVNRYTEAVSAVIQRRGGTVVEFLGDGLMALFGAPDPLPDHARVSVQAACEVLTMLRDLALDPDDGDTPIGAGIGIATGRVFVGNVRTSDRFVYTAIGDVVNLASRIQGLTRELHAGIAIDAGTHRCAGDSVARFQLHERIQIRGRTEPVDVYTLPLAAA